MDEIYIVVESADQQQFTDLLNDARNKLLSRGAKSTDIVAFSTCVMENPKTGGHYSVVYRSAIVKGIK